MASNDNKHRSTRKPGATRDRRRDQVVNSIKERPYAAAALATVAAGAAAFLLTRGKSDKPLMSWGKEDEGTASPSAVAGRIPCQDGVPHQRRSSRHRHRRKRRSHHQRSNRVENHRPRRVL